MKRTPEQILADKKRANLTGLLNRISSAISFKQIKTWRDVYKMEGRVESDYEANADSPISYPEFKAYAQHLRDDLEKRLATPKIVEPVPSPVTQTPAPISTQLEPQIITQPSFTENLVKEEEQSLNSPEWYGLCSSKNEAAFLYWFQRKAAKQLLDGILGFDTSIAKTTDDLREHYTSKTPKQ